MHSASVPKLFPIRFKNVSKEMGIPILGCILLIIGASIKVPFYPVPFTLQTFSLFLIALTQSQKQAFCSASCYLVLATIGVPVFCLHANSCWWMGKCGGYLWAFPAAAYGMAVMRAKIGNFLALILGGVFVLLCGFTWLIPFVGISAACKSGFVIFIPCELAKILAVATLIKRKRI